MFILPTLNALQGTYSSLSVLLQCRCSGHCSAYSQVMVGATTCSKHLKYRVNIHVMLVHSKKLLYFLVIVLLCLQMDIIPSLLYFHSPAWQTKPSIVNSNDFFNFFHSITPHNGQFLINSINKVQAAGPWFIVCVSQRRRNYLRLVLLEERLGWG